MQVTALYYYPIKSCRGIQCHELTIGPNGPVGDREFMLVDAERPTKFLTQREEPRLARIAPELNEGGLVVRAKNISSLFRGQSRWGSGERVQTTVHRKPCIGIDQGDEAAAWFRALLGRNVRLLWMPNDHKRRPNRLPDGVDAAFKFADGYPLLLTSETSLNALNIALPGDLPPFTMDRFRPNIVIDGDGKTPWDEETWHSFSCGPILLHGVKPCDRCAIITTDQQTGDRTPKQLKTLLRTHFGMRIDEAHGTKRAVPLFGMNLIPEARGVIRDGDPIERIKYGERPPL